MWKGLKNCCSKKNGIAAATGVAAMPVILIR